MELFALIKREFVYISYYFMVQLRQIAFYWILGMMVGSLVSVFAKDASQSWRIPCLEKEAAIGIVPYMHRGDAIPKMLAGITPNTPHFLSLILSKQITAIRLDHRLCRWFG